MMLLVGQTTNITSPIMRHYGGNLTFQADGVFGGATITLYQSLDNINWILVETFTQPTSVTILGLNSVYFRASLNGATGTTAVNLYGG